MHKTVGIIDHIFTQRISKRFKGTTSPPPLAAGLFWSGRDVKYCRGNEHCDTCIKALTTTIFKKNKEIKKMHKFQQTISLRKLGFKTSDEKKQQEALHKLMEGLELSPGHTLSNGIMKAKQFENDKQMKSTNKTKPALEDNEYEI